MKTCRSAIAALCFVAAPIGAVTATITKAFAQDTDEVTKMAREQFLEGIKAYDANQFDKARLHFLQAYALKRHPAVLLNLGKSELKSGNVEAAGNHLQQFLREHEEATEEQKQAAKAGIEEARKRTGYVIPVVDTDGASLAVDGQPIGESPMRDPYFVKPGPHEIIATKEGKAARSTFQAERGKPSTVTLELGLSSAPAPPPEPSPATMPAPGTPPSSGPGVGQPQPGAPQPYSQPQPGMPPGPMPPGGPGMVGADRGADRGRPDPITWFEDKPIAWVTVGLTGVGIVGTIGFGIAAGVAAGQIDNVEQDIQSEAGRRELDRKPCGPEDQPGLDAPGFGDACNLLRDNIDTYNGDLIGLGVMAGVAGAAAIGTVIYYFVDTSDSDRTALRINPVLGPDTQGFGVTGRF